MLIDTDLQASTKAGGVETAQQFFHRAGNNPTTRRIIEGCDADKCQAACTSGRLLARNKQQPRSLAFDSFREGDDDRWVWRV
jgi:hypothetical protein